MIGQLHDLIARVRAEFAPDLRTTIFDVDIARDGESVILTGAVSSPAAIEALHVLLAELDVGLAVRDEIVRIPDLGVTRQPHAIVTAALAPMLAGPMISDPHLSHVPLGNRLLVLREHGRWLQCSSTDGYLGWVHRGYVRRFDETTARAWELGVDSEPCLVLSAEVSMSDDDVAVRLPWGARVGVRENTAVLPDGRTGTLSGEIVMIRDLPRRFPAVGGAIVRTARRWAGAPYLWGGTTPWGVDCSGFVQAVFRTHGIELPRDSDQQAAAGIELPFQNDLENLRPGDLLFFAEVADRISHVAISMGGSAILHSAVGNGGVSENDLNAATGYERELRSLLVGARRIIAPKR